MLVVKVDNPSFAFIITILSSISVSVVLVFFFFLLSGHVFRYMFSHYVVPPLCAACSYALTVLL